jgi:hypothetical protein
MMKLPSRQVARQNNKLHNGNILSYYCDKVSKEIADVASIIAYRNRL